MIFLFLTGKACGVSEIFFKWADNQELVNDRIKTGNIAISETNGLLKEQKEMMDNIPVTILQRLKNALSDFAVSSGLQNFTKNFLKDSSDAFHAWSQWAQGNLTFKEALKYSGLEYQTGKQIGRAHV